MDFDNHSMKSILDFYNQSTNIPPGSEKQALFPKGAKILPNYNGTAPGAIIEKDGKYCVIMPGPPTEMKPMFDNHVLPVLQKNVCKNTKDFRTWRI